MAGCEVKKVPRILRQDIFDQVKKKEKGDLEVEYLPTEKMWEVF